MDNHLLFTNKMESIKRYYELGLKYSVHSSPYSFKLFCFPSFYLSVFFGGKTRTQKKEEKISNEKIRAVLLLLFS